MFFYKQLQAVIVIAYNIVYRACQVLADWRHRHYND